MSEWGVWYTLTPEDALRSRRGTKEGWYHFEVTQYFDTREQAEEWAVKLQTSFPNAKYEVREKNSVE